MSKAMPISSDPRYRSILVDTAIGSACPRLLVVVLRSTAQSVQPTRAYVSTLWTHRRDRRRRSAAPGRQQYHHMRLIIR